MKSIVAMLLFAMIFVVGGCSFEDKAPNENAKGSGQHEQQDGNKANGRTDTDTNSNGTTDTDRADDSDDEDQRFSADRLNADELKRGNLAGLPFSVGSAFDEITKQWGLPAEQGYLRGGQYDLYQRDDFDVYVFDKSGEAVTSIQLNPGVPIHLNEIRERLGEPLSDELDELLSGNWTLVYEFDEFTLFVIGKDEGENSEVEYLYLKQEQMQN